MDAEEFPTSPAKRQRTGSPEENNPNVLPPESLSMDGTKPQLNEDQQEPEAAPHTQDPAIAEVIKLANSEPQHAMPPEPSSNSLLDALMLQVEAESSSNPPAVVENLVEAGAVVTPSEEQIHGDAKDVSNTEEVVNTKQESEISGAPNGPESMDVTDTNVLETPAVAHGVTDDQQQLGGPGTNVLDNAALVPGTNPSLPTAGAVADAPALVVPDAMDAIPSDNTLIPEEGDEGAQWEIDSSPYESSSDSDTSSDDTSSEDSDDDADGDYAMLDPEEAARILMQGDGGSDDEGEGSKKREGGPLRTANERFEEIIPKPDIVVTEDMKIEELGNVEFVVESTVVIKAKTSGEYRVLEAGSLICLMDRSVVGLVADLIGRVEEPRYTIRFTNDDDIKTAGLSEPGTTVYYVPDHSTFVFTLPLKAVKGSDASNFHDEEVGDEEMEFSDDEAEAEHKRQLKAKRQGRTLDNTGRGGRGGSKFPRGSHRGGRGRGGHHTGPSSNNADGSAYGSGSLEMNYDDVSMPDANDDGYTPLQRPADLTEMMGRAEQPQGHGGPPHLPPPPLSQFKGGDFGGRGRGRGFGQNRGVRGGSRPYRGRGGFDQSRGNQFGHQNASNHHQNGFPQQNGYASHHNSTVAPIPNIQVPTTPSITPQNIKYPPMTPSPITPLPNVSFNFGGGFQPPSNFPSFPPPPPSIPGLPPPPLFPQNFNYQQQQPQQYTNYHQAQQPFPANPPVPPGQANFASGAWANNPAMAAALQRQLEEHRRTQG
ncbi:hypothetical protein H2200_001998 [Cladophialophora chaetospira]|uniref:H/ACA ribonucleoprotein complex non-core subunit NAF1 n=1 Tax=Cladophialophora chaetospira TaxID=386627 RepID=A0AA38XM13_9EURO|nr:hypothetical protein H2200_001998 [Cladophialophora chaetospira]